MRSSNDALFARSAPWLRPLLQSVSIPTLAIASGLLIGLLTWVLIDRLQDHALRGLFAEELDSQLEQRARESLIRFDQYRQTYSTLTGLLANHRRMAAYLDPLLWDGAAGCEPCEVREYRDHPPAWFPKRALWRGVSKPDHVLLLDTQGQLRESYQLAGLPLPAELWREPFALLPPLSRRDFLTKLDGKPYLVVSDLVEDGGYYVMGSLVLLVPLNGAFLAASQQRVPDSDALVALFDTENQLILASTDESKVSVGAPIESLRTDFVITAQSFFAYDSSEFNLLFATLVPRAGVVAAGERILRHERWQRLGGGLALIAVFGLLFAVVSHRLNRLLLRITQFSQRALGSVPEVNRRGNQLLHLEDAVRELIDQVLRGRELMRTRHAAAIAESTALVQAIMDSSLDAIIVIDRSGRIIEFNPTAETLLGRSRADSLGLEFAHLILETEERSLFRRILTEHQNPSAPISRGRLQGMARRIHGERFPVDLSLRPLQLPQRRLFAVYLRDITERVRQSREIGSLAALASESPIPVLRVNALGVVLYANTPSDALLRHWECRRLQTLPMNWRQCIREVLEQDATRELELRTDRQLFSLLLAPITDLGYVNIYARDITATRAAEEVARQRQHELIHVARLSTMGEMAAGLAHELNQPLSAIANFANGSLRRIRQGSDDSAILIEPLSQIALQATRSGEIIKRLRGMVSRQPPTRCLTDLQTLVREVCALLEHELRAGGVVVELGPVEHPLSACVDAVQIEQVLLNLVKNALDALQACPEGERRIRISCHQGTRDTVELRVHDNGPGIPANVQDRLFTPFLTTKEDGMGMGLAITRTIIANHHGTIGVNSDATSGTEFRIGLPTAPG